MNGNKILGMQTTKKRRMLFIISFLAPAFLIYLGLFIYPSIDALRISFTEWSGFSASPTFVGIANYRFLISDQVFWIAIGNSLIFMFIGGALVFAIGLLFAFLLTNYSKRKHFYTNIFYFPNLISFSALTVLGVFIFDGNFGLLNTIWISIGLEDLAIAWLGSRATGMGAITAVGVWFYMGFYLIIINAGIAKIPVSFLEAAMSEGANRVQIFFKITLPLIWDVLTIAISLWMINSLKLFEIVWGMTKGGPSSQTHVVGTYIYQNAFGTAQILSYRLGYASTIAVALVALVLLIIGLFKRLTSHEVYEY